MVCLPLFTGKVEVRVCNKAGGRRPERSGEATCPHTCCSSQTRSRSSPCSSSSPTLDIGAMRKPHFALRKDQSSWGLLESRRAGSWRDRAVGGPSCCPASAHTCWDTGPQCRHWGGSRSAVTFAPTGLVTVVNSERIPSRVSLSKTIQLGVFFKNKGYI